MTLDEYLGGSRVLRRLRAGPFRDGVDLYTDRLRRDGYRPDHARSSVHLIDLFTKWLADRHLGLQDVDEQLAARFLASRARHHPLRSGDRSALRRLIAVLREAEVIPPPVPASLSPCEEILESFRGYLECRRGLSSASAEAYVYFTRPFLRDLSIARAGDLALLLPGDVIGYVERHARDGSAATARTMCSRLRVFLRYLQVEGYVAHDLAACIPLIKKWSLASLPTSLSANQLRQVFQSCDQDTAVGRRDYAVLMMLARLGLRANEVATLTLEDIDWRSGQIHIRGKGRQRATMPLRSDVGSALATYLQGARPASDSRQVFLRACPPYVGFPSASGIKGIARRALKRAGVSSLAHHGSHVLRHSLATELLRSGATLTQIGQVLRHQDHDTTRIYAKVDLASLRTLCLPWPGGVQ